ncbi:hypothetical protein ACT89R_29995 (plasmid) [Rhodococcus qingshengii]
MLDFGDHPLGPLTQFGRVHCRAPRVPAPLALKLAAELAANRQPVTFRTYPTGHIEMMRAALPESLSFASNLFQPWTGRASARYQVHQGYNENALHIFDRKLPRTG